MFIFVVWVFFYKWMNKYYLIKNYLDNILGGWFINKYSMV